jgi:hypothetical protein
VSYASLCGLPDGGDLRWWLETAAELEMMDEPWAALDPSVPGFGDPEPTYVDVDGSTTLAVYVGAYVETFRYSILRDHTGMPVNLCRDHDDEGDCGSCDDAHRAVRAGFTIEAYFRHLCTPLPLQ